jgi:hypothetical protein
VDGNWNSRGIKYKRIEKDGSQMEKPTKKPGIVDFLERLDVHLSKCACNINLREIYPDRIKSELHAYITHFNRCQLVAEKLIYEDPPKNQKLIFDEYCQFCDDPGKHKPEGNYCFNCGRRIER